MTLHCVATQKTTIQMQVKAMDYKLG